MVTERCWRRHLLGSILIVYLSLTNVVRVSLLKNRTSFIMFGSFENIYGNILGDKGEGDSPLPIQGEGPMCAAAATLLPPPLSLTSPFPLPAS